MKTATSKKAIKKKPTSKKVKKKKVNPVLINRIHNFERIEAANNNALKALLGLRGAYDAKDVEGTARNYNRLIRNTFWMADGYRRFGRHTAFQNFGKVFNEVEEKSWKSLDGAIQEIKMGQDASFDLYSEIEKINYTSDNGIEEFPACKTLHDFVRCLHVSALETLFSGEGAPKGVESRYFNDNEDSFHIIRVNKKTNSDLLNAMLNPYKNKVKKSGSEKYKVIITKNAILTRAALGCHFSYADIRLNGDRNRFFVRFSNTDPKKYEQAPQRAEYVEKILKHLRFDDIEQKGNDVLGVSYLKRETLPNTLREVIRMFASTKDLDNHPGIKNRVDLAVKAFKGGTTDIINYVKGLYHS